MDNITQKLLDLLPDIVRRIKDELLLFSIAAFILVVIFPAQRYLILTIYVIAVIGFTVYKIFGNVPVSTRYINRFKELLSTSEWSKELIEHTEVYICDDDNAYQIEVGDSSRDFSEEWTTVYPAAQESSLVPIYLKVNGTRIKELAFVYCDGGRILVPMPNLGRNEGKRIFIWKRNSIEFQVGVVIGDFYIYDNMEGVARRSNIEMQA